MTGRGRPRKSMSLDKSPTRPKLKTQASLPCYQEGAFKEGKQHDTEEKQKPKKREPKQTKPTDDTPAASVQRQKSTKAKACAGRTKPSEQTTKTLKRQDTSEEKIMDDILSTTLRNLRIKRNDKAEAANVVNKITRTIMDHLKKETICFKDIQEPLRTGSYYENLKVSHFLRNSL